MEATWNTAPLKGKIKEVYGTYDKFAEAIGLSRTSVCDIINGKRGMSHKQIVSWAGALGVELQSSDFNRIFFS